MSIAKTFRYSVSVDWWGEDLMNAQAFEKEPIRVAAPTELGGNHPHFWSPEELLVNAVASCYAITLRGVAERLEVPLHDLQVDGAGTVERVPEGGYRFTAVELDIAVRTDDGFAPTVRKAVAIAKERCIVSRSLGVPVRVRLVVRLDVAREPVAV